MTGATPSSFAHFLPSASCSVVISAQWLRYVFWIPYSVSTWIFIAMFSTFPANREQSLLLSSPWSRRRKRGSDWIASSLWSHRSPNWTGQSYLFSSNWFFDSEHFCINITMIVTEPAVQDVLLLGLGFCILATCRSHSISFFIPPRSHAFNSVRLSCARKKGIGVENDPIYAVFLEYDKIKRAKETLCFQGAIPGKLFTTIRNIVEAVIC